jgi:hypothetical protein
LAILFSFFIKAIYLSVLQAKKKPHSTTEVQNYSTEVITEG